MGSPFDGAPHVVTTELRSALRFVRAAREDPAIRGQLERLWPVEGLGPVADIAAGAGFAVSVDSLRAAHAHDWAMRWALHNNAGPREATDDNADNAVAVVNNPLSSM